MKNLPAGFTVPEGRIKPWRTGQAVLAAKELIHKPFAVINADDYYGKEVFVKNYDYLMAELMDTVVSVSKASHKPTLQIITDELDLNPIKVRKLLITAGVYESATVDEVLSLHNQKKTVVEIMVATGLSKASANSCLPYTKIPYKISVTAERMPRYRKSWKNV